MVKIKDENLYWRRHANQLMKTNKETEIGENKEVQSKSNTINDIWNFPSFKQNEDETKIENNLVKNKVVQSDENLKVVKKVNEEEKNSERVITRDKMKLNMKDQIE